MILNTINRRVIIMGTTRARMLDMKKKLVDQDRDAAMQALVRFIHYDVAPNVPPREHGVETQPVLLFRSDEEVRHFASERNLQIGALEWVFEDLCSANSMSVDDGKVILNRNGVNEFC